MFKTKWEDVSIKMHNKVLLMKTNVILGAVEAVVGTGSDQGKATDTQQILQVAANIVDPGELELTKNSAGPSEED